MKPVTQLLGLATLVGLCFGAAALGSLATYPRIDDWYRTLAKPAWTPPAWLFGPVWTALYLAMAVAAWLVWRQGGVRRARLALGWFALQLLLNVAWSWLFFGLKSPALGMADIVLLWLAIVATAIAFFRHSTPAALLMLPYLGWVSFAAALNLSIWRLNA